MAYGAEVVLTPAVEGMKGAIRRAEEMAAKDPLLHPTAVRESGQSCRAPPHHRRVRSGVIPMAADILVSEWVPAAPSPASARGHEGLASRSSRSLVVEPADSRFSPAANPGPHKIQGLGAGFVPQVLNTALIDEIIPVKNEEAFAMAPHGR